MRTGLVLYYQFNGNVIDESDNGYDLIINNAILNARLGFGLWGVGSAGSTNYRLNKDGDNGLLALNTQGSLSDLGALTSVPLLVRQVQVNN